LRLVLIERLTRLWERYPALLYGLALFLGVMTALHPSWLLTLPASLLLGSLLIGHPLVAKPRIGQALAVVLLFALGWGYVGVRSTAPALPAEGIEGKAVITLDAPSPFTRHYGKFVRYPARLHAFYKEGEGESCARGLPVAIVRPAFAPPLSLDKVYRIEASLLPSDAYGVQLRAAKKGEWEVVDSYWSLAPLRLKTRIWLREHLSRFSGDERATGFLVGLATGEFDDRLMTYEFGRFGLQHVMAISGFHFSLVAGMVAFALRFIFSPKLVVVCLTTLLTTYFLFLGARPSVMRAWIGVLITLLAMWRCGQAQPLNSLGVALLAQLLFDPLVADQVGFQFSYLATAAILLFCAPFEQLLERLWPKRQLAQARFLSRGEQSGYLLLQFVRSGLALTLAIHLITLPFLLAVFHRFPLMSLLYNLFFPFLVSLSLLMVLVGMIIPPVNAINAWYTSLYLDTVFSMPQQFDFMLRLSYVEPWLLVVITCSLVTLGLLLPRGERSLAARVM